MRHTASIMIVVLTGLLIPAGARGQSHISAPFSAGPAWIEDISEEEHHVLPYAIDVNDEGGVYVTRITANAVYRYDHDAILGFRGYVQGNFIASYDADGSLRWERPGSAPREETDLFNTFVGYDVVAWDNRIYTNEGTPRRGSEYHISHGGIMINTYADDGDSLWTIFLGGDYDHAIPNAPRAVINGLGLDRTGNIYFVGMYDHHRYYDGDSLFSGPHALASFPTGYLSELGNPDIFLASYTPEGAIRWTRRMGGPLPDLFREDIFAVDDDGNTYLGGHFRGNAVFGEGQPSEVRISGGSALASFTSEGDLRWVRLWNDLGRTGFSLSFLVVDGAGHLLIGWNDATITKHSQDGSLLWSQQLLADNVHITGITSDAQGHIYAGGFFSGGPLRLGDTELYPPDHAQSSEEDGFVVHYDAEGNLRWVGHATGPGAQDITAIAVGSSGDLYVTGKFDGTLYLGSEKLEQRGDGLNMFLAKYDASTITSSEPAQELPGAAAPISNYPNPFAHTTTIEYALPASGQVRLSVYDVLGREVAVLADGMKHAGKHVSVFDATSLPSGVYLYRLEASGQARTGLMTLMK